METGSCMEDGEVSNLSIPRGGPVFIPSMVGPLTNIPDFQTAILSELQSLEAELLMDYSYQCLDTDISVDELKIISDEELVEMALREPDMRNYNAEVDKEALLEQRNKMATGGTFPSTSGTECLSATPELTASSQSQISCSGTVKNRNTTKRKRMERAQIGETFNAMVDELAKIKQKQDEDRALVSLHSLRNGIGLQESNIRMKSLRFIDSQKQVKSLDYVGSETVQQHEILLCIEVYHNTRKSLKTQEFLVLGQQRLTDLRDKIHCVTDHVMQRAGKSDPSGYFLFEEVFYNDFRDPCSIDYTKPIFEWLSNSKSDAIAKWEHLLSAKIAREQGPPLAIRLPLKFPQFKTGDMHGTRFSGLTFSLGAGYLYCHQGDCKHTIVIRDMRLMHPDDVQNAAAYPICIFQLKLRPRKCGVCNIYRATRVTVDDKWAGENPCYFCDDCYFLLHFAADGTPLYEGFITHEYFYD